MNDQFPFPAIFSQSNPWPLLANASEPKGTIEQYPTIDLTIGPGNWPSWMAATLLGGAPAAWRASAPGAAWSQSAASEAPSDQGSGRGILGQLDSWPIPSQPLQRGRASASTSAPSSAPSDRGWYRNSPSWVQSAMPLGANVPFSAAPAEPAYQPWADPQYDNRGISVWDRPSPIPRSLGPAPAPVVPLPGPDGWYYPGAQLDPTPPPPPKDFRTRLNEALSNDNVRYYAGPGFYEALEKLAALTQFMPGSGTAQAEQDVSQARQEASAGNYWKAAAHMGTATANTLLDWMPAGKLAILGGMGARTFPWAKLKAAELMERAGRSVDEIWQATGLARGAEGGWRFEISDRGYRVNPKAGIPDGEGYRVAPLYEHHVHPGMQEAYPELAGIRSKLRLDRSFSPGGRGAVWPNEIEVEGKSDWLRHVGIHELQHLIDRLEGFARGGSKREFLQPGVSRAQAKGLYHRLAGEVAARNAQFRLDMPEAELRLMSPLSTERIPRDQQIIRYFEKK